MRKDNFDETEEMESEDGFVSSLAGTKRSPYVASKPEAAQEKSYRRTAILICVAALSIVLAFYSGLLGEKNLADAKMFQGIVQQQKTSVVTASVMDGLVPVSENNCFDNGTCVYLPVEAKRRLDAGLGMEGFAYICVTGDALRPVDDPASCAHDANWNVVAVPTATVVP